MKSSLHLAPPPDAPSICFIIPYFGKWPFWFPFFLASCQRNPCIHWHIHSDCGIPKNLPPNIRFFETSFPNYCAYVSRALDIDFRPDNPYKLCDLKPALGKVHREELRQYDFWAFGDIDVVYGDLSAYFSAERLSRHDIYSTHRRRISGHLCLLRNNDTMCNAFESVKDWKTLLACKKHVAFDESAFSRLFVRHKNWPDWLADLAKPLHRWASRIENIEAFSTPDAGLPWISGEKKFPAKWFWNKGQLTNDLDGDRQFPYLHFMAWKQGEWQRRSFSWTSELEALAQGDRWKISADGFSAVN